EEKEEEEESKEDEEKEEEEKSKEDEEKEEEEEEESKEDEEKEEEEEEEEEEETIVVATHRKPKWKVVMMQTLSFNWLVEAVVDVGLVVVVVGGAVVVVVVEDDDERVVVDPPRLSLSPCQRDRANGMGMEKIELVSWLAGLERSPGCLTGDSIGWVVSPLLLAATAVTAAAVPNGQFLSCISV
ncbi:unnamed protein product, partial [Hydatigera taeniaeformis]|uniref:Uncharacterized protein n=1 Tax=Hydatigena taeniaeformis TaxID=6205 RepID=A0A0R3X3B4_HYDTA